MLGSLGSIVLVATMGKSNGGRGTHRRRHVPLRDPRLRRSSRSTGSASSATSRSPGPRTEYLRYLANVRKVAREAADQQRRALTWHHPDPSALPALAEERSRVWEHGSNDPGFMQVRYGVCAQPLALELVPPESTPIDQVDPAAASALHRLLVVHRLQPDLPASIDLRAFDRVEVCGAEEPGPLAGPLADLLGDRLPLPREPRRRGALPPSTTWRTGTG